MIIHWVVRDHKYQFEMMLTGEGAVNAITHDRGLWIRWELFDDGRNTMGGTDVLTLPISDDTVHSTIRRLLGMCPLVGEL